MKRLYCQIVTVFFTMLSIQAIADEQAVDSKIAVGLSGEKPYIHVIHEG
ncbi:MAG: hypothetical protein LC540_03020 [Candidatus Thiodiazotropha sp.]|nr:hypothetical protein [Candidatus Thiodiazotropha sp.]